MKLVVAITGASGSLYAQRLLQLLNEDAKGPHEVHVALSAHAREVAEAEVGKVIGRSGRIARALRTVLASAGAKNNRRYALEILE